MKTMSRNVMADIAGGYRVLVVEQTQQVHLTSGSYDYIAVYGQLYLTPGVSYKKMDIWGQLFLLK